MINGIDEQTDKLKELYSQETSEDVQPNFENVKLVADNIAKVITLADALLTDVLQNNIDNVDLYKQVVSMKSLLTLISNDSNIHASLYADKTKLDALYSIKDKIDSIYADKTKHDSIYADKTKLDAIYLKLNEITIAVNNIAFIQNAEQNAITASNKASEVQINAEAIASSVYALSQLGISLTQIVDGELIMHYNEPISNIELNASKELIITYGE